jgi:nucleotide-binding universal stress UspA family protein
LIEGDAATVLAAASRSADLIVVGSRGSSGFRTMLFGSVTLLLVECAACPVAVIPPQLRSRNAFPD